MHDVIIIGSGPGGAITANELDKKGLNVLMIEAGKKLSLNDTEAFTIDEMLKKYWNGGTTVSLGSPKISYVAGKCFGGGSEVNSGLYHRIPDDVKEHWIKYFSLTDFEDKDLEPHYDYCEKAVNVSKMPIGTLPKASQILQIGADKLNWKCLEVPRWFKYQSDQSGDGVKQSMTETFLSELSENVKFAFEKTVLKLERIGHGWKVICHDKTEFLTKNIFLSAGAIQTPAILMRSKLGKNLGNHLQFHPTIKATAEFNEEINSEGMGVPVHQVKEFSPLISMGCSISSLPYLSLALADFPNFNRYAEENWKKMGIYYAMIRPETSAKLMNIPFSKDPLIRYQLSDNDLENLRIGLKELCRLLFVAGAKKVFPSISDENYILNSFEEFDQKIPVLPKDKTQLMTIHLFSSCPMGENTSKCVTNSFGKVHGENNLYINDASLLCTSLGVNPQGAVMAVARRNVMNFLEKNYE